MAILTATALLVVVGSGVAHADQSMSVTPSSGLTDGQLVHIVVSGLVVTPFSDIYIAECANAYADGTPLASVPNAPPFTNHTTNCSILQHVIVGSATEAVDVAVPQTGIGSGNRSCVSAPPAAVSCRILISASTNQGVAVPPAPVAISFAGPPANTSVGTTTTLIPIGTPVGLGKTATARVGVATANPTFRAQGSVTVTEGPTTLGTAAIGTNGVADVTLAPLGLGVHPLVAHFAGDSSFTGSDSAAADMTIIGANNITIGDASVVEGDSLIRYVVFPVVLSKAPTAAVSVTYTVTSPGGPQGATVGTVPNSGDVTALTRVLKFTAGNTTAKYIKVKVVGDGVAEGNEFFHVVLSGQSPGWELRRPVGTGTIIDDDIASGVRLGVGDSLAPEGDAGRPVALRFAVSLSSAPGGTVTVTLSITNGTATRGTRANGDWGGSTTKTVSFGASQVSKWVTVAAFPELVSELDETVNVTVTNVTGPVTSTDRGSAVGTILSDE